MANSTAHLFYGKQSEEKVRQSIVTQSQETSCKAQAGHTRSETLCQKAFQTCAEKSGFKST